MKKRILALLLTLALVLPAVSCDILLADPNAPVNPSDSQEQNNPPATTEKAPVSVTPESQPQTPPDDSYEPEDTEPNDWYDEPQTEYVEPETEYIPKKYTVTFVLEGYDEEFGIQIVKEGNTVGSPTVSIDPAIGTFDGVWYTDPYFKQIFDFDTYIAEDITLYGRFVPNPAAPALMITPQDIADLHITRPTWHVGSVDVLEENTASFVRLTATGDDPCIYLLPYDTGYTLPKYMAIRYRTNAINNGQFFMGSSGGPTGQGDNFMIGWEQSDAWNLVIVDLSSVGLTSITNNLISYIRMDFFGGRSEAGDYFDIAYIGFFSSPEYAEAYDFENYPPYIEVDNPNSGKVAYSIDSFYVNGSMYFPEDGGAGDKLTAIDNTVPFGIGEAHESMALRGWIGFNQPIVSFGYYVDSYTMIWGDFAQATEAGVKAAGGEHALRFMIEIPIANLKDGAHTVGFVVKLADGTVVRLRELTVRMEKTMWDEKKDIVVHQSFDELYYGENRTGLFTPGYSNRWNKVATFTDFSVDTLNYWGWMAYNGEFGQLGYQINGGAPVYDDAFAFPTEQDVINVAHSCGADSGSRMKIAISLEGLLGTNTVTVLYRNAKGVTVVLNEFTVKLPIRPAFEVPEHYDETVTLGIRGNGGAYNQSTARYFGQRFTITDGFLKQINITDMATYADGNVNTWKLTIWAWNTDYKTTVSDTPWYTAEGKNHPDNTTFTLNIPAELGVEGDIYYEIEYISGSAQFTGWLAQEYANPGVQSYIEGRRTAGTYASSIVVGIPKA